MARIIRKELRVGSCVGGSFSIELELHYAGGYRIYRAMCDNTMAYDAYVQKGWKSVRKYFMGYAKQRGQTKYIKW